jgi:dimethyladenosine transferase 1, mitochondrial
MLHGLKEILNLYKVKAHKNLSQNFIFDQNLLSILLIFIISLILGKIVSVGSMPTSDTAIIEIGPAAGNLTRALLGRGYSKLLLIEKDDRFKPILEVNFILYF